MNDPLYNDETPMQKAIFYIVAGGTSLYTLVAIIIAVVFGAMHHFQLIFLAGFLLLVYAAEAILTRWWRKKDLDPKAKWLVFFLLACIFIGGLTIFISTSFPGDDCKDGFYNLKLKKCIKCDLKVHCYNFETGSCYGRFPNCNTTCIPATCR
eukprot:gnl/Trimastix_PCT/1532.p1 GENE.gnl/Trimastix_PCT/1532~~gnl/Trimastix_PCT/1532.p1  ORF type:complete len:152 (-),score=54.92 gnl/Trimastix_PCT/1532:180-635(-)